MDLPRMVYVLDLRGSRPALEASLVNHRHDESSSQRVYSASNGGRKLTLRRFMQEAESQR